MLVHEIYHPLYLLLFWNTVHRLCIIMAFWLWYLSYAAHIIYLDALLLLFAFIHKKVDIMSPPFSYPIYELVLLIYRCSSPPLVFVLTTVSHKTLSMFSSFGYPHYLLDFPRQYQ